MYNNTQLLNTLHMAYLTLMEAYYAARIRYI
jgi:hypothetical protein